MRRINKEDRHLLVGEEILRLDGDEGSNRGCISGVRLIKRKVRNICLKIWRRASSNEIGDGISWLVTKVGISPLATCGQRKLKREDFKIGKTQRTEGFSAGDCR